MRDYIILSATMLLLVGFTDTKSFSKSNIKGQRQEELEENMANSENVVPLNCCGTCGSSEPCSCPCRPQPDCTSSCIAIKAAQEARAAAAAQTLAAAQASHQVKAQLAEKAIQAAKAAEAALAGKLVLVSQLEHEVCEAQAVVMEEANSGRKTQYNLQVSLAAAGFASQLLKKLLCALRTSQSNLCYSQQAVQGTSEELAEKLALLEAAKCRLNALMRELCVAKQDLAAISQAACKAQAAARCACACAQRCKRETKRSDAQVVMDNTLHNVLRNGKKVREIQTGVLKR